METISPLDTQIRPYGKAAIEEAAALIAAGQCVAVPTETVYGLAADANNGEAVAGIYAAKGRPSFNPLIVHVPDMPTAEMIAEFDDQARALAEQFWPGPLTLVLPVRNDSGIASLVTAGLPSVAVRVPAHPAMQDLLRACARPLAAPSANASGTISPTRAEHVLKTLKGRIPLIIDAGPTEQGLESTILAFTGGSPRLLRPGPISVDLPLYAGTRIEAPGQMTSHYAPAKPLRLNVTDRQPDEWLIGFGPMDCDANLSETSDLNEAAARLFDLLHQADMSGAKKIAITPVPATGLGLAINDRLARAAA